MIMSSSGKNAKKNSSGAYCSARACRNDTLSRRPNSASEDERGDQRRG